MRCYHSNLKTSLGLWYSELHGIVNIRRKSFGIVQFRRMTTKWSITLWCRFSKSSFPVSVPYCKQTHFSWKQWFHNYCSSLIDTILFSSKNLTAIILFIDRETTVMLCYHSRTVFFNIQFNNNEPNFVRGRFYEFLVAFEFKITTGV